jgi:hypothetical protein
MIENVIGYLVYFGSLLLPLGMLLLRPVRNRWRSLVIIVFVHVLLIVATAFLIAGIGASGNPDWMFALYYYVVVNILGAASYLCFAAYAACHSTTKGAR